MLHHGDALHGAAARPRASGRPRSTAGDAIGSRSTGSGNTSGATRSSAED